MTTSAQAACEDALLTLMLADATLGAVAGKPQIFEPQDPKDEHIWIAEDSLGSVQSNVLTGNVGNSQRQEDFDIRVVLFVAKTGDVYKAVRDRGVVLTAALETLVRANQFLSGTAWYAEVTSISRSSGAWDKRRGVVFVVTVHCRQFLVA